ncbi:class I SAM-dependent methyltransferase [Lentimicrobium sp. L6]|uniref:class I SAM-dependent methyltransferase n=1 Tax=Lentimicrobium sp. L6 TaxID=2735916 RepID=UPI001555FDD6|nr:class I SAM-dependent methyltransferase [Lentimicrobium sp. L6]NPD83753.1 class I SAM-dependent methyltransferase [Lentimicrobium sp. L6]
MINVVRKMITINGFWWTAHVVPYVLLRKINKNLRIKYLDKRIKGIEIKNQLPGMNSKEINSIIWENWNWKKYHGEEWTYTVNWKNSIIKDIMQKHFDENKTILEIGPGGGKWTESLIKISRILHLTDISNRCLEVCQQRFKSNNHINYHLTDGCSLSFLKEGSIDYIWSFDVFVHIAPDDVNNYIDEFKRVLKPGGKAIIHHAGNGGISGGWRSNLTQELFKSMVAHHQLKMISQFDSWGENNEFDVKHYQDIISIFEKKQ